MLRANILNLIFIIIFYQVSQWIDMLRIYKMATAVHADTNQMSPVMTQKTGLLAKDKTAMVYKWEPTIGLGRHPVKL